MLAMVVPGCSSQIVSCLPSLRWYTVLTEVNSPGAHLPQLVDLEVVSTCCILQQCLYCRSILEVPTGRTLVELRT
jgi:hypothetical protein